MVRVLSTFSAHVWSTAPCAAAAGAAGWALGGRSAPGKRLGAVILYITKSPGTR